MKKKKNKKKKEIGFTLVELLAVIVILAILGTIAIGSIVNYLKEGKELYNSKIIDQVVIAGKNYFASNKQEFPAISKMNEAALITLSTGGYLSRNLINLAGNDCMENSYVIASKCDNGVKYYACVKCYNEKNKEYETLNGSVCNPTTCDNKNTHTITYNLQDSSKKDGTKTVNEICTEGDSIKIKSYNDLANQDEKYNYEYWYNTDNNKIEANTDILCDNNYTFNAHKTLKKQEGKVIFNSCKSNTNTINNIGASTETSTEISDTTGAMASISYHNGEEFLIPESSYSRPGFTFQGWSSEGCGSEANYKPNDKVSTLGDEQGTDVNLYAIWKQDYTGVPKATYSNGDQITYAGKTWTVINDYGNYLGLVANTATGSGAYTNSKAYLNTNLANANSIINNDKTNKGMYLLDDTYYIDSNNGYKGIISNFDTNTLYWTKSGNASTSTPINQYSVSNKTWASGYMYQTAYKYSTRTYATQLNSTVVYAANSSIAIADSNGSLTIPSGTYTTGVSPVPLAEAYMRFHITGGTSSRVYMTRDAVSYPGLGIITASSKFTNTKKWVFIICGGDYSGRTITITASSSSAYKYSFPHTTVTSGSYSKGAKYITLAGNVGSTLSSTTRTYNLSGSPSCQKRTTYAAANLVKPIYYRPHLVVREAP